MIALVATAGGAFAVDLEDGTFFPRTSSNARLSRC